MADLNIVSISFMELLPTVIMQHYAINLKRGRSRGMHWLLNTLTWTSHKV